MYAWCVLMTRAFVNHQRQNLQEESLQHAFYTLATSRSGVQQKASRVILTLKVLKQIIVSLRLNSVVHVWLQPTGSN